MTALVSHPDKVNAHANLRAVQTDVLNEATLATQLRGHDAVISAFSGHAQGDSKISLQDYAVAMMDELEKPAHSRRRFTVGY
ncbi:NAD(P)H-binding protein [Paralcaligenes sp. KSB-10]|uniref:NAD(P)H-binding protein n=1 Tax=Paralcaligenes sp. KSB-10 TaxID=2901142 RepID=UPI001E488827|nr:NAD(P)H-binding protein [Paralcaligenes sp. KSB-10]UHL64797.1 NAD(P)H-binding protein [Paralcaligenes sp. KSB-10]